MNGQHYRIKCVDDSAPTTFDSRIATPSYIDGIASKNDLYSHWARLQYYGILEEIVEVQLSSQWKEVLFKGKWYNTIVYTHNCVTQIEDECELK